MARFGLFEQYFDSAGDPLIGGKLYVYESGTTTPKATYSDVAYTTPNTNPIVLGADGRMPDVFFAGEAKIVLTDADDVQISVLDPIGGESLSAAEVKALYDSNPDTNTLTDANKAVLEFTGADLTSGLASTDELIVNDGGTVKKMDISVLQAYLEANLAMGNKVVTLSTGSGSWSHPADLNSEKLVYVTIAGGGGGGAGTTTADGGGGGGAGFAVRVPMVLSGTSTAYAVGAGGAGGSGGTDGADGGQSYFGTLYVQGGSGAVAASHTGGDGGIPSTASAPIVVRDSAGSSNIYGAGGADNAAGTDGLVLGNLFGGGGGGGGSSTNAGGDEGGCSGNAPGGAPAANGGGGGGGSLGAGGDGGVGANGSDGTLGGGGGGGVASFSGGAGGDGIIILEYAIGG